ncbi:NAD(P)-binding protein [Aspergillus homomorphus CBS 101889]|uniref:NAD(P)-binding protein n=1 Tax=Aspergillus homomorphus (strain CBS 101889) TaxID=1450537 RepID=A0A395HS79_ASPHC|nr:NAD(P)-binding protein [Aspergillus homomorphus CBS 101889]RAL10811.1 NAD(P)-binding protein [Aspergillus homomorphus CBS 101889]
MRTKAVAVEIQVLLPLIFPFGSQFTFTQASPSHTMVYVAVAGGHGGVGRTTLEVLQESSDHKTFVLSRKSGSKDGRTIQVDYTDAEQLVSVLEAHAIHTVLSQLEDYFKAIEVLRQSDLQWTVFLNGIFLDYFGPSTLRFYLKPNVFVMDRKNKVAGIPGDGEAKVTFTYTFDLALYVVAMLDVEDWPEESRVIGDTVTWNVFVRLAEEICRCHFEVHYDSVEKLKRFEITELPGHQALYQHLPKRAFQWFMSIFELYTLDGSSCATTQGSLNERFPDIQPLTAALVVKYK